MIRPNALWAFVVVLVLAVIAVVSRQPAGIAQADPAATETKTLTSLPIEPILEGPLELSEITATSATLRIDTSLDVACVVVYGPDESFGQLALDQDMGLRAHRNHLVVLRGLEPDSAYVYRLQGSDPNGNFYASRVLRFRTPPADAAAASAPDPLAALSVTPLGRNVARDDLGAVVSAVSSNYGGGDNASRWGADNAIDGDPDTEWSSAGDGDEAFITITLPNETTVSGFGLWTRTMGSSAQIGRFVVESDSGETFGPFELPDATGIYTFPAAGRGRTFTFRVVASSGGNTGVVELAVYATD